MSKVVDSKGTAPKLKFSEFCGFINWKYSIQPKPVKFSFNAFPKLQRISSESGWRMYRGLWWRQMKHDINRDDVYNEVLLHIFWREKQIVTFKTSTFLLFRFVPLFQFVVSLDLSLLTPSQNDWNIESSSWKAQFFTRVVRSSVAHSIIWHFSKARSINSKLLVALFSICQSRPEGRKLTL